MAERTNNPAAVGFVAHWARVGPILDKVKRDELRAMSEEQHLQAVANVLALAKPDPILSQTSGLVEQQRIFALGRQ